MVDGFKNHFGERRFGNHPDFAARRAEMDAKLQAAGITREDIREARETGGRQSVWELFDRAGIKSPLINAKAGFWGSNGESPAFGTGVEFCGSNGEPPAFGTGVGFWGSNGEPPAFGPGVGFYGSNGEPPAFGAKINYDGFRGQAGAVSEFRSKFKEAGITKDVIKNYLAEQGINSREEFIALRQAGQHPLADLFAQHGIVLPKWGQA